MKNINLKKIVSILMSACMMFSLMSFSASAETLEAIDSIDDTAVTEENADDKTDEDSAAAGNFNEDNKEVTTPAKKIRLKTAQRNNIVIGKTFQIKYSLTPSKSDDYVTFRNYNRDIVKVDENGLVTAIGYGTAKVQLKAGSGAEKNIYFIVTDINGNEQTELVKGDATSISFVDQFATIRKGKTFQIEPIFYPLGIYDDVTYTSSNSKIASVSKTGLVKALKAGSAVIIVKTDDGISAEFNITVYDDIFKGIDVSKWQNDINWKKVSADGIDFAMIRSSYGSEHTDEKLKKNVAGCEKYGIDYGFYHYTYAKSDSEARKEAKYFLKTIKNYDPTYPVVLDIEEEYFKKMSRKKVTDIIVAFMEELENAGYYAMIYSSPNFINNYTDFSRLTKYDIWIACWGDEDRLNSYYDGHYGMWQYSSTGSVRGITGDVDLDYAYKDYAYIIEKNGLNK